MNETQVDAERKKLKITTHDSNGMVLSTEEIEGVFGDKFSTQIVSNTINSKGDREMKISTLDENGKTVCTHNITVKGRDNQRLSGFLKGRVSTFKHEGQKIRAYSLAPVISGKTFFKQKIYENVGMNG